MIILINFLTKRENALHQQCLLISLALHTKSVLIIALVIIYVFNYSLSTSRSN